MLIQTVKPPQARVEVFFDNTTGQYSGQRLLIFGSEIEMLEEISDDEGARQLIDLAAGAIDVVRARVDESVRIWQQDEEL